MTRTVYRSERVFHVNDPDSDCGGWFFEVRGSDPQGPFATRRLAEISLAEDLPQMPDTPRSQNSKETEGEG